MERLVAIATELRTDDLYRMLGFDTWDQFCTQELGVSKSTANRWIASSKAPAIGVGSTEWPKRETAGQSKRLAEPAKLIPADSQEALDNTSEGARVTPASPGKGASSAPPLAPSDPSGGHGSVEEQAEDNRTGGLRPARPPALDTDTPGLRPTAEPEMLSAGDDFPQPLLISDADAVRWLRSKTDAQVRALGDPWRPTVQAEVERWALAMGIMRPKEPTMNLSPAQSAARNALRRTAPVRLPGRVIRPEDRATDPVNCTHPKDREHNAGYFILCGVCRLKLR